MTEELIQILTPVVLAIAAALGSVVIYAVKVAADKAKVKIDAIASEQYRQDAQTALAHAQDVIDTVVKETNQRLVDDLKRKSADGKLTGEEISQAFNRSYWKTRRLLGDEALGELKEILPDAEAWIAAKIEASVTGNK